MIDFSIPLSKSAFADYMRHLSFANTPPKIREENPIISNSLPFERGLFPNTFLGLIQAVHPGNMSGSKEENLIFCAYVAVFLVSHTTVCVFVCACTNDCHTVVSFHVLLSSLLPFSGELRSSGTSSTTQKIVDIGPIPTTTTKAKGNSVKR